MENPPRLLLFVTRILVGWLLLWDGLQKLLSDTWSAGPELLEAQFLPEIFAWFADPGRVELVSKLNIWGLIIIGSALIIGLRVRFASLLAILLLAMYYLLNFDPPMASIDGFLIDRHVIYIFVLLILNHANVGKYWGLDRGFVVKLRG